MRQRQLALVVSLSLIAATVVAADATAPRIFLDARDRLVVSDLPPLVTEAEVRRHLDSGLTTSFVIQAQPRGGARKGAARVDMRLELWDELYLVTVIDGEGRVQKSEHDSAEALGKWWSDVEIVLSMPAAATDASVSNKVASPAFDGAIGGSQVKVSLAVVPFSQAELVDTQKWLTESMSRSRAGSRAVGEGGASRAVGALIATSMQRRAVRSMTWNLEIARRDKP